MSKELVALVTSGITLAHVHSDLDRSTSHQPIAPEHQNSSAVVCAREISQHDRVSRRTQLYCHPIKEIHLYYIICNLRTFNIPRLGPLD